VYRGKKVRVGKDHLLFEHIIRNIGRRPEDIASFKIVIVKDSDGQMVHINMLDADKKTVVEKIVCRMEEDLKLKEEGDQEDHASQIFKTFSLSQSFE
jgi:hypothetical protein